MKCFTNNAFILLFIMVQIHPSMSQTTPTNSFNWELATALPSSSDTNKQPGLAGPVTGIHKDILMVGGGANFPDAMPWFGGKKKYYDDVFLFVKNKEGKVISCNKNYKLPFPIAYGAGCNTEQGIVYAGGENESGLSDKVLLIQWNEVTESIAFKSLPQLPFPVANASITAMDNRVYLAGGEKENDVSNKFMFLDLQNLSAGWQVLPDLPNPISHAVMVVQSNGGDNGIYLIGGRKRNTRTITDFYATVSQFNLKTNSWSKKALLPYSLSAGTGLAINNNSILLFGGDKGVTFHKAESLIMAINKEKDPIKREELNQEKIRVQTTHPGFSKSVLAYNTHHNQWTVVDSIPFEVPVTTTALKWGDKVVIPSGEIKAGIRTPNILSGQLK